MEHTYDPDPESPVWIPPRGRRWTIEDGRRMHEAFAVSGLGLVAFARLHQITPQRVIFWRERCRAIAVPLTTPSPLMRQLALVDDAPTRCATDKRLRDEELVVNAGPIHFRVHRTTDVEALTTLLRALTHSAKDPSC